MNNSFQFFDIILFAMIAVFLVLRLRGVLGRRDGHQGDFPDIFKQALKKEEQETEEENDNDNVIPLESEIINENIQSEAERAPQTVLQTQLNSIVAADNEFESDEFISGARIAFEYILNAALKKMIER